MLDDSDLEATGAGVLTVVRVAFASTAGSMRTMAAVDPSYRFGAAILVMFPAYILSVVSLLGTYGANLAVCGAVGCALGCLLIGGGLLDPCRGPRTYRAGCLIVIAGSVISMFGNAYVDSHALTDAAEHTYRLANLATILTVLLLALGTDWRRLFRVTMGLFAAVNVLDLLIYWGRPASNLMSVALLASNTIAIRTTLAPGDRFWRTRTLALRS